MSHPFQTPIRGLIIDMDGVLWRADLPIGDLPAIFAAFKHKRLGVVLATNNSTRTPEQYVEKLETLGVRLERWQVVNSSQTAARYLSRQFPAGGAVFMIGEDGLRQALLEAGFVPGEQEGQAVVVGMDRKVDYEKLTRATLLIRGGRPFIATNADRTFPTPLGLVPGAGAILAALETATDTPAQVVGKPAPEMYRVALERLGMLPAETLVIGDRLETDIAGAQALGCPTALVLSGVTTAAQASQWSPPPDLVVADLAALVEQL